MRGQGNQSVVQSFDLEWLPNGFKFESNSINESNLTNRMTAEQIKNEVINEMIEVQSEYKKKMIYLKNHY